MSSIHCRRTWSLYQSIVGPSSPSGSGQRPARCSRRSASTLKVGWSKRRASQTTFTCSSSTRRRWRSRTSSTASKACRRAGCAKPGTLRCFGLCGAKRSGHRATARSQPVARPSTSSSSTSKTSEALRHRAVRASTSIPPPPQRGGLPEVPGEAGVFVAHQACHMAVDGVGP